MAAQDDPILLALAFDAAITEFSKEPRAWHVAKKLDLPFHEFAGRAIDAAALMTAGYLEIPAPWDGIGFRIVEILEHELGRGLEWRELDAVANAWKETHPPSFYDQFEPGRRKRWGI